MLQQIQSYFRALVLCSLIFTSNILGCLLGMSDAQGATSLFDEQTSLYADQNPHGVYHTDGQQYHKSHVLKFRLKSKTWFGKAITTPLNNYYKPALVYASHNTSLRSAELKPDYYLFLFRLTPF